jgi:teichuronic acid biosynthesis glycosyltransferase TuaC
MRVLVIAKDLPSPASPHSGIFVLRQMQALAALGFEVLAVRIVPHAPGWTEKWRRYRATPDDDVVEGIPVRTIRAVVPPRMLGFEYLPLQIDAPLRRIVADFDPNVIHGHFLIPSGQLAVRYGIPSVLTAHGSDAYDWAFRRPGLRRAASEGLRHAGIVVAVSDFIRRRVLALFKRDVRVVHNGADESLFFPSDRTQARNALDVGADRFVIAFAGQPSHPKGAFDLVEAAARMTALRPLVLFAGPSVADRKLASAVAAGGIDARLCGIVTQSELARLFAAADVFCLPSYREGLPASICEAMLSGRPVVATPVGGIPEIVSDDVNGYLVPVGEVDALAQRLEMIARNPALAMQMGRAAHEFASTHLTWRHNAKQYVELYQELLHSAA